MVGFYILGGLLNIFIVWYVFKNWIKMEKKAMKKHGKMSVGDIIGCGLLLIGVIWFTTMLILDFTR